MHTRAQSSCFCRMFAVRLPVAMQSRCLPRYFFTHARLSLPLERVLFHTLTGIERSNVTAWPANGRHSRPLWPRQTSTTFLENPSATLFPPLPLPSPHCLTLLTCDSLLLPASCTENPSRLRQALTNIPATGYSLQFCAKSEQLRRDWSFASVKRRKIESNCQMKKIFRARGDVCKLSRTTSFFEIFEAVEAQAWRAQVWQVKGRQFSSGLPRNETR